MSQSRSPAGDEVYRAILENPDVPSKSLARQLYAQHPELWANLENCRKMVCYYRGNNGQRNRADAGDKTLHRSAGHQGDWMKLPAGLRRAIAPAKMPPGKYLVLADLHVPYHKDTAIEAAVRYGKDAGCESLYLNGDFGDFYSISRWQKDPRQRSLLREIETQREVLRELAKPFAAKWFKFGNHDDRWELHIWNRAEEFADFKEFELPAVLRLADHGYQVVQSRQRAEFGLLNLIHGHEFARGFSSPVNPARGLWLKMSSTAACSHFHRTSQHSETHPMKGTVSFCWSMGCMCDTSPEYDSLNKWNTGFAIITVRESGEFHFENHLIDGGKVYAV